MFICVLLGVLSVIASMACTGSAGDARDAARMTLTDCELPGHGRAGRCGTYLAWENPTARAGRKIALTFIVVPATGGAARPDPVFYFDGGPGASAVDASRFVVRLLSEVNETRDLVFVDVRGTGRSNPLHCEPSNPSGPLQQYFSDILSDDYVRACLAAQTADVRFYTQPIAVDDVDEIRGALGYERINLFGASGGTRAAQIYIRRHPAHVRTAVMHGVHPMDGEMPLAYSRGLETGLRGLLEACAADATCRALYPTLPAAVDTLRRRFEAGDVEAEVTHPVTGAAERVRISRGSFAEGLRHLLYDLNTAREVPAVLTAAAGGNFSPFARLHVRRTQALERSVARGMFLSSTCAEDVRFISEEDVIRETAGTFLGDYRVRRQQAACAIWPRGEGVDERFQEPVQSDVPVLLLSGAADVATPPSGGERVARHLPRSRHVVFPNQAHGFANPDCTSRLVTGFIAEGSAERLDVSCVGQTRRPAFSR